MGTYYKTGGHSIPISCRFGGNMSSTPEATVKSWKGRKLKYGSTGCEAKSGRPRTNFQQLCSCGCGNLTNFGRKFVHGHHTRTPEFSKFQSSRLKGNRFVADLSPDAKKDRSEKLSVAITGKLVGENHPMFGRTKEVDPLRMLKVSATKQAKSSEELNSIFEKKCETQRIRYGRATGPVKDTKPERIVQDRLVGLQINFLPQHPMYGTIVDFYLPDIKTCIFVDGCYWHGCPKHHPTRIQERDFIITQRLLKVGYAVTRLWECDILKGMFSF